MSGLEGFTKGLSASGLAGGVGEDTSGKSNLKEFKSGGKVKKTGPAKLHKGERVLTKKEAKRYKKRSRRK